jgi:lantibiotic biosynthesis protein
MTGSPAGPRPAYRPLSGFAVRAPLLPAGDFERLAYGPDGLRSAWALPEFRLAVCVASPDLAAAVPASGEMAAAPPRAQAALQRYVIRACLRPTPFGGFAGVALGRWSDRTTIRIAPGHLVTRTRPDMGWLTAVAQQLGADPTIRPSLRIFANPCALDRNGRIYLADRSTGGTEHGPDVSVRATTLVRAVLARAADGAVWSQLRQLLLESSPRATEARADQLLSQLCEQQLLLPELLPALTGDPLGYLAGAFAGVPAAADWEKRLLAIGAECASLDAAEPAEAAAALPALRRQMSELAAGQAEPLQLDAALPLLDAAVSRQVADDLALAADALLRLHPAPLADGLADYRAAFHRKYGDDRRVPVLELLDPRFGLGPPGAHAPAAETADAGGTSGQRDALLQGMLAACLRDGLDELALSAADIDRLSAWTPDPDRLPPSLELSAFVAAASRSAVDRGDYLLVIGPNLGAGAAGRGLGRFADMLGPDAHALLAEAAAADCSPASLTAELVYRPVRARTGNVAVRPLVRAFEVPIGVAPSLPPDAVIRIGELSVRLRNGRLRLFWERGGREVSLAAGHMLNQAAAPPLCRHLMELASDGIADLHPFGWGSMAAMPYLPRVRTGRVVLHPARWRLDLSGDDGTAALASQARFDALLVGWREQWRLPRHAYLTWADNRLLLDLDDAGHRAQLRGSLRRPGHLAAVLQEPMPGPADAWLPGRRGRHIAELVVPLVLGRHRPGCGKLGRKNPSGTATGGREPAVWPAADRIRPPGSDWLYLALNGPRGTEDELLAGPLGDLADGLVERGDADGWFFVRHGDPDRQLRVRLHGPPEALTGRALPALMRWGAEAVASGSRTSISLQSYERELERYGGPETTALCERIACADSHTVRRLLAVPGPAGAGDRLELGLLSLADLLVTLVPAPAGQAELCKAAAGSAAGASVLFREKQDRLRALIATVVPSGADVAVYQPEGAGAVLAGRRAAVAPLAAELHDRFSERGDDRWASRVAPSLLHLHANRLGLDRAGEQLAFGLVIRALRSIRAFPAAHRADSVRRSGNWRGGAPAAPG